MRICPPCVRRSGSPVGGWRPGWNEILRNGASAGRAARGPEHDLIALPAAIGRSSRCCNGAAAAAPEVRTGRLAPLGRRFEQFQGFRHDVPPARSPPTRRTQALAGQGQRARRPAGPGTGPRRRPGRPRSRSSPRPGGRRISCFPDFALVPLSLLSVLLDAKQGSTFQAAVPISSLARLPVSPNSRPCRTFKICQLPGKIMRAVPVHTQMHRRPLRHGGISGRLVAGGLGLRRFAVGFGAPTSRRSPKMPS